MRVIFKFIPPVIAALITTGCIGFLDPPKYYIGGYTVRTEEARQESFRDEVKQVAAQIAGKLGYVYSINSDDIGGVLIAIYPRNWNLDPSHLRITVEWGTNGSKRFFVNILKNGPEETKEIKRIREGIEEVLREHPSFKAEFELSHRSMWQ